jgi:DNA-binding NarL/FixJ family response regulator
VVSGLWSLGTTAAFDDHAAMLGEEQVEPSATDAIRLVLVEDDEMVRERLGEVLEEAGVHVVALADSVAGGLAAVLDHRPDVVVVDNRLPDGRGIDLCAALVEATPDVALVLHSAFVAPDDERLAIATGVAAVVPKSVRPQGLLDAVRRHGRR